MYVESRCAVVTTKVLIVGNRYSEGFKNDFGKGVKGQQGWSLYRPVIAHKVGHETALWPLVLVLLIDTVRLYGI